MSAPYDNSQVYTRAAEAVEERYLRLVQMSLGRPRMSGHPRPRDIIRVHVEDPTYRAIHKILTCACKLELERETCPLP
jgi:hypothetical protein